MSFVIKIKFLSFISQNLGIKELKLDYEQLSIVDALTYLRETFPNYSDLFEVDDLDLTIIADGKTLHLPKDLDKEITRELVISPIIAGG